MFRRREFGVENPDELLGMDDTYRFECQRCGECCTRPGYFTPEGLEEAAGYLDMEPSGFFKTFCEVPYGGTVIRPRLEGGYCSLMERDNGKAVCTIHEVKPHNCRYSPLLPVSFLFDDDAFEMKLDESARFVLAGSCPDQKGNTVHSVREIVEKNRMEDDFNFQSGMMIKAADYLGRRKFMRIVELSRTNMLGPDLAIELRNAVMSAYGL